MSIKFTNISEDLQRSLTKGLASLYIDELLKNALELNILREVSFDKRLTAEVILPSFGLKSEAKIAHTIKKLLVSGGIDPSIVDINIYSSVMPAAKQSINIPHIANVKNIILVSSGKGGVGKSTVAVNLATSLAHLGAKVGLLDADIYGPSIPTMFGIPSTENIKAFKDEQSGQTFLVPPIKDNIALMSIGFLVDTSAPMIWRGPMIASASMQMFLNVYWGDIDYLIVDLPPGTGDIQLTIAQKINVSGAIIVSTPQDVALMDVTRAKNMFDKVSIPILGLVENMSYFVCNNCDERHEIFSNGGAVDLAMKLGVPVLAEIPIAKQLRSACDIGEKIEMDEFKELAHSVVASIVNRAINGDITINAELNKIEKNSGQSASKKNRLPVM